MANYEISVSEVNNQRLTRDAAGVPGHRVGDIVLFGGSDDYSCPCAV